MERPKIYTAKCESYDLEKIREIVFSQLDAVISDKYNDFDFEGKKIAVKPNLLAKRAPSAGITTDPSFIQAVCEYFLKKGANVVICDSPGGVYNSAAINAIYNVCGMSDAAERSGAQLNRDFGWTEMTNKEGVASKSFNIINPLAEADFIVDVCRIKTHSLCNMSCAVKNLYGAVPGLQKAEQHARFPDQKKFSQYLIDLCLTVKPSICVVDGIIGMEGNGPAGGTLKKVGLILCSDDPFSLDLAVSHIMGFEPEEVLTVANSIKRNLCPEKLSEIDIIGEDIEAYVSAFKRPDSSAGGVMKQLPSLLGGRVRKLLEPRPYIMREKCVGCGECAKCCPQSTIKIENGKAHIDYEKCIRCYCCQELCPMKAVSIKSNPFMKL